MIMNSDKKFKSSEIPLEQFFAIRTISSFSLSPEGKYIYYITNITGTPQIWRTNIQTGYYEQVLVWSEAIKGVWHNPKSAQLVFASDFHGNEQSQLYSFDLKTFETIHLTKEFDNSQCHFHGFDKEGSKIYFSTNKRLKYNFDTYSLELENQITEHLFSPPDVYPCLTDEVSPDGRYLSIIKFYSNLNQDIIIYDLKLKEIIFVTGNDPDKEVSNSITLFDKHSNKLFFVSDEDEEFKGIQVYDIKKNKKKWIVKEKYDVIDITLSKDSKLLSYAININGRHFLKKLDLKSRKISEHKKLKGVISSLKTSHNSKYLYYIYESPENPSDIVEFEIKTRNERRLTNSTPLSIPKSAFTEAKDITYTSFDGLKIHALLYIPKGIKKNGKNPAMVWVHGGPEWQEVHNFNKYIQILTNAGFVVISPNYRGSIGYGRKFQKKIYKDWGGDEYKDVLESVEILKKTNYIDENRIGIGGGSFGGFLSLTCVTKSPDIWKCGVDIFGPSNLFTFLKSIPPFWKKGADRLIGNIETDKDLLFERSPINFVDNIKCPMFVVQGKYDMRVAEEESNQIVEKLRQKNKPVEYILLEDEGHGFSKVVNQINVFKKEITFLEKYLKGGENG